MKYNNSSIYSEGDKEPWIDKDDNKQNFYMYPEISRKISSQWAYTGAKLHEQIIYEFTL